MKFGQQGQSIRLNSVPFNITFLSPGPQEKAARLPVTSLGVMNDTGQDYHPNGLYSPIIFGVPGSKERDTRMAYIPLRAPVFHPVYFKELNRLKGLYGDIIMGKRYAIFDAKEKDFLPSDGGVLDGETGIAFFMKHFDKLVFKQGESKQRQLRIQVLEHFRKVATMDFLMVIPAGLRDVQMDDQGRPVEEDINALYKKVISNANTINPNLADIDIEILDNPRRAIQKSVNDVFDYIFSMLEGKKGFLAGKFGARRVFGSTRNVISSMEVDSEILGDPRMPDMTTTIVGLFQYMKASEPILLDWELRQGFLKEHIENAGGMVKLIDPKTYKSVEVEMSNKQKDKWGTEAGLEGLLNGYELEAVRHKPITIDGKFLKLVYQDDKNYRIMSSIDELPEGRDRANVRPMTWTEMFYLHTMNYIDRTRCLNTRYPVTGLGSIYPNKIYVKTTTKGLFLKELGEQWEETGKHALEFPDSLNKGPFHQTMNVHPVYLPALGADFD